VFKDVWDVCIGVEEGGVDEEMKESEWKEGEGEH
jgi:hypothetical protein